MNFHESLAENPVEILFVDDDFEDFQLTEAMLKSQAGRSFSMDWGDSFDAGLEQLMARDPDACLVDYHLGGHTGIEFVREAKARGFAGPIIILTGRQDDNLDQRALDAGAVDYLEKSTVNANLLSRAIRYAIHRKRLENELLNLASHDSLTGLANRSSFDKEFRRIISTAARTSRPAGLFLLDIDHFKRINDSMGHRTGDAVLCELADRLRQCSRDIDVVSRWGGDEFAIIAENVGEVTDAAAFAQRIVDCMKAPIDFEGSVIHASISVGAVYCQPIQSGTAELLQWADEALYLAKSEGRNGFAFYDPDMNAEAKRRCLIRDTLTIGIEKGGLDFAGQPIIEAATGGVAGIELLVRLPGSDRSDLDAAEVMRTAEDSHMIWSLTRLAIEKAGLWHRQHLTATEGARVSINLSPKQVRQSDTPRILNQILLETGVIADQIELEIPEGGIARDPLAARHMLDRLREAGFALCLDHFSAARLSLLHLAELPFDRIKLGRTLCRGAMERQDIRLICEKLADLCRSLDIRLTAHAIETPEELALFRGLGFDLLQGFKVAPPKDISALG